MPPKKRSSRSKAPKVPPAPTMPAISSIAKVQAQTPSLDTLSFHIMCAIAHHSDEQVIWRLMATCRSLREAGEKALKPYLEEKVVTAKPTFMIDRYNAIPYNSPGAKSSTRLQSLLKVDQGFTDHLLAYPPSFTSLKRLTIELRGQDESKTGWDHLRQLLPQLESLNLHIYEPLDNGREEASDDMESDNSGDSDDGHGTYGRGCECGGHTPDSDEGSDAERDVREEIQHNIESNWRGAIEERSFPNLTTLSLSTTMRAIEHLDHIAGHIPNLQNLTIGAHWSISDLYDYHEIDEYENLTKLTNLVNVTIIGGPQLIVDALTVLMSYSPSVKVVTLHCLEYAVKELSISCDSIFTGQTPEPMSVQRIDCLALYGGQAFDFAAGYLYNPDSPFGNSFHHITSLILERDPKTGEEARLYPLLDDKAAQELPIPSLRTITWIDRDINEDGAFTLGMADPIDVSDFYEELPLRTLFNRYRNLSQVQWIAGYPINPFTPDDPSTRKERNVRCYVPRPKTLTTTKRSAFIPVFPYHDSM